MKTKPALQPVSTRPIEEHVLESVYRYAVTNGGIASPEDLASDLSLERDEVETLLEILLERRLLRVEQDLGGRLAAVDPEIAASLLVSPMKREIYHRHELIAQVHERTERLRDDYARSGGTRPEAMTIERVNGEVEVRGYLKLKSETCKEQVLALQSGQLGGEAFDDFLRLCLRLLQRGVEVRILCQHRSRADLITRMKLRTLIEAGGRVRTVSNIPRAAVVLDRRTAVLLGFSESDTAASGVSNEDVVQFLLDLFENLWEAATPVESVDSGYAEVAGDLQHTIVSLMAKGFTDEVLARRLGMSVRTCRRHIATLMRDLDAVSRFQAGVEAGRRAIVDPV
jgi:DNA-binding CsgD family transcriptional regulator